MYGEQRLPRYADETPLGNKSCLEAARFLLWIPLLKKIKNKKILYGYKSSLQKGTLLFILGS